MSLLLVSCRVYAAGPDVSGFSAGTDVVESRVEWPAVFPEVPGHSGNDAATDTKNYTGPNRMSKQG